MACAPLQFLLAATVALGGGETYRAQPQPPADGPVIVGERREGFKPFELQHLEAALEFYGEQRNNRLKQAGQSTLVDRETILRETLDLSGEAYIGHRNLIDLSGTVSLGLEDRYLRSDTAMARQHDTTFLHLYDIRALILGNGPVPVTAYARREQSLLDRAFAGSIEQTLTEAGAIAQIRSDRAPTTLQYFHRQQDQSDQLGLFDSSITQDAFTAQSGIALTPMQHLDLNYTFDHVDESQQNGFSDLYDRHDLNLTHTAGFGDQGRHQLRSNFRFYDQSGRSQQQVARLDELLLLRHTDQLETRYTLSAQRQERAQAEEQLLHAEASVRHSLFQSLVSTATIGAESLEGDGFGSDQWFVSGSLDYTKQVPRGRLDASAGAAYNAQHNSARGGTLSIINEPHSFNDPFPIVLSRRNIVAGSIVVTGPGGIPTFQEGLDYIVTVFPDRAELRVIIGGGIIDGQTVLVSYDLGPEPSSDIDTFGTVFSARYTLTEGALAGLSFYTSYRTVDHSLSAADPTIFVLDDVRDLLLGTEYVNRGLDLKVEHQIHDSTVSPFDATRFQALYTENFSRNSVLGLDFTHELIKYHDPDNRVVFTRLTGRWDQRLSPELQFNLRLEYRDEDDSLLGNSQGFDQILGFTWRKRQTTIYGSFRNVLLEAPSSDTTSQTVTFGIRRDF